MNYIGHQVVARESHNGNNLNFLFGSMLPDLARIAGTRSILALLADPDAQNGISFHRRTNKAFDTQPEIEAVEDEMKVAFRSYLPWRTAIQASHVSKDLLFDGYYMTDLTALENVVEVLEYVLLNSHTLGQNELPDSLKRVTQRICLQGPPDYLQPSIVSRILIGVLAKTRTPIDGDVQPQVFDTINSFQPQILSLGSTITRRTITLMAQSA